MDQDIAELEEAVADHRARLARVERELGDLRSQREALGRIVSRYGDRDSARLLLDTDSGAPPRQATEPAPLILTGWAALTRTEAIERLLKEADQPLTLEEIEVGLKTKGRQNDERKDISAALSHLRNRVRSATQVRRGVWAFVPPEQRVSRAAEVAMTVAQAITPSGRPYPFAPGQSVSGSASGAQIQSVSGPHDGAVSTPDDAAASSG
jgi:hypothetical protein